MYCPYVYSSGCADIERNFIRAAGTQERFFGLALRVVTALSLQLTPNPLISRVLLLPDKYVLRRPSLSLDAMGRSYRQDGLACCRHTFGFRKGRIRRHLNVQLKSGRGRGIMVVLVITCRTSKKKQIGERFARRRTIFFAILSSTERFWGFHYCGY